MRAIRFLLIVITLQSLPGYGKAQTQSNAVTSDPFQASFYSNELRRVFFHRPDSTIYFAEKMIEIAEKTNNDSLLIIAKQLGGEGYRGAGQFSRSIEYQLDALKRSRELKNRRLEAISYSFLGFTYLNSGIYRQALDYCIPAYRILDSTEERTQTSFSASNVANCYTNLDQVDSADLYNKISWRIWQEIKVYDSRRSALRTLIFDRIGMNFERKGNLDSAIFFYRQSMQYAIQDNIPINIRGGKKNLARVYLKLNKQDSAKFYALASMSMKGLILHEQESAIVLDTIYRREGKLDSALIYQTISMQLQDSLFGPKKVRELQALMVAEQELHQQQQQEISAAKNRLRLLLMTAALLILLSAVFILRRGNKIKQDLNGKLQEKNIDLEKTLSQLKSTQAQLIQSEKMASLGELTAGIAHEIQNPLNFVNNFSEVNTELFAELISHLQQGNQKEVEEIAMELQQNEIKINHHGKRADTIVKSMLQHSRASSGQKELKDINTLCDEYARLAYHGMRSKDNSFSIDLKTNLDPSIKPIAIIAQDIGRVLLNIINNALYAVQEKIKTSGKDYAPEVFITTALTDNHWVVIKIKDNGVGVPEKIRPKIFQPFFTTKPTGEGTGLGLSLSFDIIRAHGGQINLHSKEGEGTEFEILLPIEN